MTRGTGKRRSLIIAGLAIAGLSPLVASRRAVAEIVHLKDGTQIEGSIRRGDDGWTVTDRGGQRFLVPFDRVSAIEATPKAGVDVDEQRLASLRHATENNTDIRQVIERYRQFIDQHPAPAVLEKAKADVLQWQDRLDRGLVKAGDKWVTPSEKTQIDMQSAGAAAEAAQMIAQGHLHEAAPALDKALASNPANAAAWYLKGVLLYRQDHLPAARKAFEAAAQLMPDDPATLNNLAVILWRQNACPAALNSYDRALQAHPGDRRVLDNLAEALFALPEEQRTTALTKKVVRRFNEQDLALQAKLKVQGLLRWGAQWVTSAEAQRMQQQEKEIQDKIALMSNEFDALTARIKLLEANIDSDEKLARRMEIDSLGVDATGRAVRYPLPASYYDVQRDLAGYRAERAQDLNRQAALRRDGKQLRQQMVGMKYTGLQKLIDVEGAPIPNAAGIAAAYAPAAAPAAVIPIAPTTAPSPAVPVAPPTPPTAPAPNPPAPTTAPAPAAPAAPTTQRGDHPAPHRPRIYIPPEKPSILERQPDDTSAPGAPRPGGLLDDGSAPPPPPR